MTLFDVVPGFRRPRDLAGNGKQLPDRLLSLVRRIAGPRRRKATNRPRQPRNLTAELRPCLWLLLRKCPFEIVHSCNQMFPRLRGKGLGEIGQIARSESERCRRMILPVSNMRA